MPLKNLVPLLMALYGGIILITVLGVAFLIRSFYYSKRYLEQKELLLRRENEKARLTVLLLEETNHRLSRDLEQAGQHARLYEDKYRLQAELLSSVENERQQLLVQVGLLQKEVMAATMQLERKNEVLHALREKLSQPGLNMGKLVHRELLVDDDFDTYRVSLKNIHPDFFHCLHQKAVQRLTPLDEKYCALIYMKLSNKQMAAFLNVEPRSIQMTKYRLKQKFGLGKDDTLDVYIREII